MKRIVEIFAVVGALVPIGFTVAYLVEVTLRSGDTPFLVNFVFYFWPSAFMLLGPRFSVIGWVMAMATNIVLYAFIGVVIKYAWFLFSKLRDVRSGAL